MRDELPDFDELQLDSFYGILPKTLFRPEIDDFMLFLEFWPILRRFSLLKSLSGHAGGTFQPAGMLLELTGNASNLAGKFFLIAGAGLEYAGILFFLAGGSILPTGTRSKPAGVMF